MTKKMLSLKKIMKRANMVDSQIPAKQGSLKLPKFTPKKILIEKDLARTNKL